MSPDVPDSVLVAPDSFKGSFRAAQVAGALVRGLDRSGRPAQPCPVADGGEGTCEVLLLALGGETAGADVSDPLGRPLRAGFGLIEDGGTAIVEVAAASGLELVGEHERDAFGASTRGTGELVVTAARTGAAVIVVAAGGSATTDGGVGAIEAIEEAGGLGGARLVVLCDVRTPWEQAPGVFGPQKGADAQMVARLKQRLELLAATLPRDPRGVAMTGAAGGLAGGLWARFGATLVPGAAFVLDALDFDARMRSSRAVIVGEGRLDRTTLQGKIAGEIATRARQSGVPCFAVAGENALDAFDQRILDIQAIEAAPTLRELEAAGERLAALI